MTIMGLATSGTQYRWEKQQQQQQQQQQRTKTMRKNALPSLQTRDRNLAPGPVGCIAGYTRGFGSVCWSSQKPESD